MFEAENRDVSRQFIRDEIEPFGLAIWKIKYLRTCALRSKYTNSYDKVNALFVESWVCRAED